MRDLASDILQQKQIYILYSDNSLELTAEVQQGQAQSTFLQLAERCAVVYAPLCLCEIVFLACVCVYVCMFI